MYQTLYRKYRPTCFDEVVGQKIIVRTLKNTIENHTLSHAYLFTGPRGTGKTSVAKILAKTVNCENLNDCKPCNKCVSCTQINNKQSIDIIEIDAASNNGVDEIRELKSKVSLVPSVGKYKVYIIDEVHMLTTGAFNALLKTLEEPPEHIIFILATTEPHKIPATILSRCQRFDFKRIPEEEIYQRLKYVSEIEKIEIEDNSLMEIARLADGGLRDALSLLDQVIAYSKDKVTLEDVHEINGTLTPLQLKNFIEYLINHDIENLFRLLDQYDQNGKNFVKLSEELILFLRNCLLAYTVPTYLQEKESNIKFYQIQNLNKDDILKWIQVLNQTIYNMKISSHPKILLEVALIDLMNLEKIESKKEVKVEKEFKVPTEEVKKSKELEEKIEKSMEKVEDRQNENKSQIDEIIAKVKHIRINNTLCNFNKKSLLDWKSKLNQIENELTNPENGQIASLILDGELKAVGNQYFIFVYENSRLSNLFNEQLLLVDSFLNSIYHNPIHAIATNIDDWNRIKKEFNSKTKTYQLEEEPIDLLKILKTKSNKSEIENMFENIIQYEN